MLQIVEGVRLAGIPCQAEICTYRGYRGAREGGLQLEPDEPAGWDLNRVLDRKGYPALWLERKLEDVNVEQDFMTDIADELVKDAQDSRY